MMIERLPGYYQKSEVVKAVYAAVGNALDKLDEELKRQIDSLYITTTEDFSRHEKDVGLSAVTADNATKVSRVIARLQGSDLLTPGRLKSLVYDFVKTGCTIREDFAQYTVYVTFSGRTGIPYNIEPLKAAVDEVVPAHIKISYIYIKNTWADIRKKFGTWGNMRSYTWDGVQLYDGRTWLYADSSGVVWLKENENGANAYAEFFDGVPFAVILGGYDG